MAAPEQNASLKMNKYTALAVAASVSTRRRRNTGKSNSAGDWSQAPIDILALIAAKIKSIQDFVRFGAACRSWNAAAKTTTPEPEKSPWLMVAAKDPRRLRSSVYGFYTFTAAGGGDVLEIKLPEIREMMCSLCCGSPFGWVVTKGRDFAINLFNPLSRELIALPNLGAYVSKAILTSNPSSPDCLVFMIYSVDDKLAFSKPSSSDCDWSFVESEIQWKDIVKFGGNLYGCSSKGHVYKFDFSASQVKVIEFAAPPPGLRVIHMKYLVELGGELCLVARKHILDEHYTRGFKVYKLNMCTKRWTRVKSLGDHCLFVGGNYTFSVEASGQFKPNCIYFTDAYPVYFNIDAKSRGYDTGAYHVEDSKKEHLIAGPSDSGSLESYPTPPDYEDPDAEYFGDIPPIWIIPSLR